MIAASAYLRGLLLAGLLSLATVAQATLWDIGVTANAYLADGESGILTVHYVFDPADFGGPPDLSYVVGPGFLVTGTRAQMGGTIFHNMPIFIPPFFLDPYEYSFSFTGQEGALISGFENGWFWAPVGGSGPTPFVGQLTVSEVGEPTPFALLVLGAAGIAFVRARHGRLAPPRK